MANREKKHTNKEKHKCTVKYKLKSDKTVKYLEIKVPKTLSDVYDINYLPITRQLKEDIQKWTLLQLDLHRHNQNEYPTSLTLSFSINTCRNINQTICYMEQNVLRIYMEMLQAQSKTHNITTL